MFLILNAFVVIFFSFSLVLSFFLSIGMKSLRYSFLPPSSLVSKCFLVLTTGASLIGEKRFPDPAFFSRYCGHKRVKISARLAMAVIETKVILKSASCSIYG